MLDDDNRIRALEEKVKDLLEVLQSFAPSPFIQKAIAEAEEVLYRDLGETKFYGELVHPSGLLIVAARVQGRELFLKTGPTVTFKRGEDAVFTQLQGHTSMIGMLDLGGFDDELAILSGSLDNNELLDEVISEVGDNPNDWLPVFHERRKARVASSKLKVVR